MITLEWLYVLTGVLFAVWAVLSARDASNPRRWANAAFWGLLAASFLAGSHLADLANGVLVLALVGVAGFGRLGRSHPPTTTPEEREALATRFGSRLFVPALVIPLTAVFGTVLYTYTPLGSTGLFEPKRETLILLGVGVILALAVAMAMLRPRAAAPLQEGRRLMDAIGWAAILPQMLAALGAIFALAGVGTIIGSLATQVTPEGSVLIAVVLYCAGMALFTIVMGNAFAAFPVMAAAIGIPVLINHYGGYAPVIGAVGMLAGFCGTLLTPMAANFNIVPAALLELKSQYGVIRMQAMTAILLFACNILLIYALAFPMKLTEDLARNFARIALGHVAREYPHKLDHVMAGDGDAQSPRALHPAFFGSFDWHSCVHGWWTLLSLRRLFPAMPEAAAIADLADRTFSAEKLAVELAYLARAESRGFERPYGWGWLLALHGEAARHPDRDWATQLDPLAAAFAGRFEDFLPLLTYPITVGTHYNTAFALTLARDWAAEHRHALAVTIDAWAQRAFAKRSDYRGWEPGGDEFLSPVLTAALLMSRVLPRGEMAAWLEGLVIDNGWVERECRPVTVSDRSDGKIAHLDGLNLSRAWCLDGLAAAIAPHPATDLLVRRAEEHRTAALPHVAGDYMGEHWLASFALLAFGVEQPG